VTTNTAYMPRYDRDPLSVADSDPLDHLCLYVLVREAGAIGCDPVAPWEIVGSFAAAGDARAVADRWVANAAYDVALVDAAERTQLVWTQGVDLDEDNGDDAPWSDLDYQA
jgi:hypothetical protein